MRIFDILLKIINYIKARPVKWSDRIDLTSTMKNVGGTFTPTKDGILYVYAFGDSGYYSIVTDEGRILAIKFWGPAQSVSMPYKAGVRYKVTESAVPNKTWVYAYNLGGVVNKLKKALCFKPFEEVAA